MAFCFGGYTGASTSTVEHQYMHVIACVRELRPGDFGVCRQPTDERSVTQIRPVSPPDVDVMLIRRIFCRIGCAFLGRLDEYPNEKIARRLRLSFICGTLHLVYINRSMQQYRGVKFVPRYPPREKPYRNSCQTVFLPPPSTPLF